MHRTLRATAVTILTALAPLPALAHAAVLEAQAAQAIHLQARYDTGTAMAGAQVVIFAPGDDATIWGRGRTDANGRFVFVPDPDLSGRWTVQVRHAGHGAVAHVRLDPDGTATAAAQSPAGGWLQRAVMVALVGWGALGTTLYFRRRGGDASA